MSDNETPSVAAGAMRARSLHDVPLAELADMNSVTLFLAVEEGTIDPSGHDLSGDSDYSRKAGLFADKIAEGRRAFELVTGDVVDSFARSVSDDPPRFALSQKARAEYDLLVARKAARERLQEEEFEAEVAGEIERTWVRRGDQVLTTTEIPFIVRDRIHQVGIGQLSAQPYQGKTLVGLDLALSVANGLNAWLGYEIENPGPVVYLAGEGGPAVQVHIDAWIKDNPGCTLDDFVLVDEMPIDWTVASSVARLDRMLHEAFGDDESPVLVVGDTQIDFAGLVDENTIAMGHVFRDMRRWAVENGFFFLLMHHMGHMGGRGRGHSSQFAKADVLAVLEGDSDTVKKMTWTKVKGCQKPSRREVLQIRPVAGSKGAVIEPKPATAVVAEEAGRLTALEQSIIEAVRHIQTAGVRKISKNAIRNATRDDGKIVVGAQAAVNAKIDDMVTKGWLTNVDGYGVGDVPD